MAPTEPQHKEQQTAMFTLDNQELLAQNVSAVLREVFEALLSKGYDPVGQIVGYLLSGDPSYITSFREARRVIRQLERDEILEVLVRSYLKQSGLAPETKPASQTETP